MWNLILSLALAGLPAPIPDAPTWAIAANGEMVELYGKAEVVVDKLPADEPEEEEVEHTGQVITEPKVVSHTKHYGCQCAMCRGLHLANAHGIGNAQWNRLKLWQGNKMDTHHAEFHKDAVFEKPKPKDGCGPGGCPAPQRVGIIKRTVNAFRWRK